MYIFPVVDGVWEISSNLLEFFDPTELPVIDDNGDTNIWTGTNTGEFSVASAYECIRKKFQKLNWTRSVWHKSIHPSIASNVWKLVRG